MANDGSEAEGERPRELPERVFLKKAPEEFGQAFRIN